MIIDVIVLSSFDGHHAPQGSGNARHVSTSHRRTCDVVVGESGRRRRRPYPCLALGDSGIACLLPHAGGVLRVEVRYSLAATCLLIARNTAKTPSPLMAEAGTAVEVGSSSEAARSDAGV